MIKVNVRRPLILHIVCMFLCILGLKI